jgi:ribosomal protein S17E
VKPFYSGRIASKLMAKYTSLLTKNTAFEHKFQVDMRKWQK